MKLKEIKSKDLRGLSNDIKKDINYGIAFLYEVPLVESMANSKIRYILIFKDTMFLLNHRGSVIGKEKSNLNLQNNGSLIYFSDLPRPISITTNML